MALNPPVQPCSFSVYDNYAYSGFSDAKLITLVESQAGQQAVFPSSNQLTADCIAGIGRARHTIAGIIFPDTKVLQQPTSSWTFPHLPLNGLISINASPL